MAYLVICLSFGLAGGFVGKIKGSSFWLWFLISAVLPFAGLIAAVLYRFESDELRRQCPGCGRIVQAPRRALHALRHRAGVPRGRDRAGIRRRGRR